MKCIFKLLSMSACVALFGCASVPSYESKPLNKVGETLYADPGFSAGDHVSLQTMMRSAKNRLVAFYGEQRSSDPDVIFCKTDSCSVYFAGTEKRSRALGVGRIAPGGEYRAARPTIVITRQGRTAENVLVHELSHIEHMVRFGGGRSPSWFNEGVATYMAGEPNCERLPQDNINHLEKIVAGADWETYTNDRTRIRQTYCQAAEEIRQWVNKNGKPALLKLMNDVKWGKSFNAAYGALQTVGR